jgi:hypothetical protein
VGGLTLKNYDKRKSILSELFATEATFYSYFPEDVIWSGFSYFKKEGSLKKRYQDSRIKGDDLITFASQIIHSNSYQEFIKCSSSNVKQYSFKYFQKLDEYYSQHFFKATHAGNLEISKILKETNDQTINISHGGRQYELSSRKAIKIFFDDLPFINSGITLLAYARDAMRNLCEKQNETVEQAIYDSYNDTVDIFIKAFSEYTVEKAVNGSTPSRNDLQDLLHLCYLRNSDKIILVSEDKIFKNYIPKLVFSVEELVAKQ